MDAYQILGVTKLSSMKEVRKQFKKIAMDVHPDKGGSDHLFQILKKSYVQVLQDIKTRQVDKQFNELKDEHNQYKEEISSKKNVHLKNVGENELSKKFNMVFESNKMKDENSRGYGKKMTKSNGKRDDIEISKTINKFSIKTFNKEFEKTTPINEKHLIKKYNPQPFILSNTLPYTELGLNKINDFSTRTDCKNGLQYTDYMKAHTTNRLSQAKDNVSIPKNKTITDIEKDRANISFIMDENELKKYTMYTMKENENEMKRLKAVETKDKHIHNLYEKVNKSMIEYKI